MSSKWILIFRFHRPFRILLLAIFAAYSNIVYASLCALDPIEILHPTLRVTPIHGFSVQKIQYKFDEPAPTSINGRKRMLSNISELILADVNDKIDSTFNEVNRRLPRDICDTIVDNFKKNVTVNGSALSVNFSGNGRQRGCMIWETPTVYDGYKITMEKHTSSVTLANFSFSITYLITPVVTANRKRVDFNPRIVENSSDVDLELITVLLTNVLAPAIENYVEKEFAKELGDRMSSFNSSIGDALPSLEPYLEIDRIYQELVVSDARFLGDGTFSLTRRLPKSRDSSIICALRKVASQRLAYDQSVKRPVERHTVKKDESLWRIAEKLYGDGRYHRVLLAENKHIQHDPDKIRPGTTLDTPPMHQLLDKQNKYRVEGGDSLWRIYERRYGDATMYVDLINRNPKISINPDLIYPLDELLIGED